MSGVGYLILKEIIDGVRQILPSLVAILAATIMLVATNAGMLGISRLTFNLSSHRQLPGTLSRIHSRFRTPYIAIIIFGVITLLMLTPGFSSGNFYANLGSLYVFGSLLVFGLAHAAIISLRIKQPKLPRPFKLRGNLHIKNRDIPVTAILGLLATFSIWVIIIVTQSFSRWSGIIWVAVGLIIYFIFRRRAHLPMLGHAGKMDPYQAVQAEKIPDTKSKS
jgi:APA family basic amino acid/polyamine antiporter